jgi:hypothetical protein
LLCFEIAYSIILYELYKIIIKQKPNVAIEFPKIKITVIKKLPKYQIVRIKQTNLQKTLYLQVIDQIGIIYLKAKVFLVANQKMNTHKANKLTFIKCSHNSFFL